ncbi:Membrane protein [Vibrio jasicida]|uniref:Membrane protein n=2 Tax=Vibrionaceae TaxID=641 RepID=A0AAU9QHE1_9VIBR|nr:Membrane protein [Vibrio jasicida]CAH1561961.1 Membrane protein [Vibrio jasicida]CAH1571164.1 Membrane protein [Vibrio jasicida]CAH1605819.1 Membrane protein [Vibrio jasicida]
MEHINELLMAMKPLLEQYGYLALIVSIFLEGIGIPMPGQSLMIAASIISSEHVMNLSLVMIVSWLSCFLGNTCGYLIGYYFEGWLDKKGYISGPKMQKLQSTIQKYGPACLVVSRFVEGMKQFMPLACGIAKMPRKEFLLGNALATTIWVAVFSLLTNFAFEHLSVLSQFYTDHRYVVWSSAALLFSLMIFALLKRKKA